VDLFPAPAIFDSEIGVHENNQYSECVRSGATAIETTSLRIEDNGSASRGAKH
jgi:hypothetical protein